MNISKLAVTFKVFFPQIIERRKIDSLESDRFGFKFWVCQIFALCPGPLSPSDPQFPHLQNEDDTATSQVEMSINWIQGHRAMPGTVRLLKQ